MKSPDPVLYLLHIRDACQELLEWQELRDSAGLPRKVLFYAVCRALEIIGEASRKIGAEFRAVHPELPWRHLNDLRNIIIHNYGNADEEIIWRIVEKEIPSLLEQVRRVLAEAGETR